MTNNVKHLTAARIRRGTIAVGAVAVVAVASQAAIGSADPGREPTRAQAALASTQAELADTQHRVTEIQLEHIVDGREVYSLGGPDTRCILVARQDQDAGRSESLACSDTESAAAQDEQRPFHTGFASGTGYVDLVWPTTGMPAQVAADGARTDVRLGSRVIAASRVDDDKAAELRWNSARAGQVQLTLPSDDEREALASSRTP